MERFAERILAFLGLDRDALMAFPGFTQYADAFRSKQVDQLFTTDQGTLLFWAFRQLAPATKSSHCRQVVCMQAFQPVDH